MREMKIVAKSGNKLCLRWRPPADWNPLFSLDSVWSVGIKFC